MPTINSSFLILEINFVAESHLEEDRRLVRTFYKTSVSGVNKDIITKNKQKKTCLSCLDRKCFVLKCSLKFGHD